MSQSVDRLRQANDQRTAFQIIDVEEKDSIELAILGLDDIIPMFLNEFKNYSVKEVNVDKEIKAIRMTTNTLEGLSVAMNKLVQLYGMKPMRDRYYYKGFYDDFVAIVRRNDRPEPRDLVVEFRQKKLDIENSKGSIDNEPDDERRIKRLVDIVDIISSTVAQYYSSEEDSGERRKSSSSSSSKAAEYKGQQKSTRFSGRDRRHSKSRDRSVLVRSASIGEGSEDQSESDGQESDGRPDELERAKRRLDPQNSGIEAYNYYFDLVYHDNLSHGGEISVRLLSQVDAHPQEIKYNYIPHNEQVHCTICGYTGHLMTTCNVCENGKISAKLVAMLEKTKADKRLFAAWTKGGDLSDLSEKEFEEFCRQVESIRAKRPKYPTSGPSEYKQMIKETTTATEGAMVLYDNQNPAGQNYNQYQQYQQNGGQQYQQYPQQQWQQYNNYNGNGGRGYRGGGGRGNNNYNGRGGGNGYGNGGRNNNNYGNGGNGGRGGNGNQNGGRGGYQDQRQNGNGGGGQQNQNQNQQNQNQNAPKTEPVAAQQTKSAPTQSGTKATESKETGSKPTKSGWQSAAEGVSIKRVHFNGKGESSEGVDKYQDIINLEPSRKQVELLEAWCKESKDNLPAGLDSERDFQQFGLIRVRDELNKLYRRLFKMKEKVRQEKAAGIAEALIAISEGLKRGIEEGKDLNWSVQKLREFRRRVSGKKPKKKNSKDSETENERSATDTSGGESDSKRKRKFGEQAEAKPMEESLVSDRVEELDDLFSKPKTPREDALMSAMKKKRSEDLPDFEEVKLESDGPKSSKAPRHTGVVIRCISGSANERSSDSGVNVNAVFPEGGNQSTGTLRDWERERPTNNEDLVYMLFTLGAVSKQVDGKLMGEVEYQELLKRGVSKAFQFDNGAGSTVMDRDYAIEMGIQLYERKEPITVKGYDGSACSVRQYGVVEIGVVGKDVHGKEAGYDRP
eukprot:gene21964-28046_t